MATIPPLCLTPAEAAEALGIPLEVFEQQVMPSIQWVDLDGPRIPVKRLEEWLAWRSQQADRLRTKAAA